MMLTDDEQNKLLEETDGPTTEKINKRLSEAEQRILEQLRPVVEKVNGHDDILSKLRRGLGAFVKG